MSLVGLFYDIYSEIAHYLPQKRILLLRDSCKYLNNVFTRILLEKYELCGDIKTIPETFREKVQRFCFMSKFTRSTPIYTKDILICPNLQIVHFENAKFVPNDGLNAPNIKTLIINVTETLNLTCFVNATSIKISTLEEYGPINIIFPKNIIFVDYDAQRLKIPSNVLNNIKYLKISDFTFWNSNDSNKLTNLTVLHTFQRTNPKSNRMNPIVNNIKTLIIWTQDEEALNNVPINDDLENLFICVDPQLAKQKWYFGTVNDIMKKFKKSLHVQIITREEYNMNTLDFLKKY